MMELPKMFTIETGNVSWFPEDLELYNKHNYSLMESVISTLVRIFTFAMGIVAQRIFYKMMKRFPGRVINQVLYPHMVINALHFLINKLHDWILTIKVKPYIFAIQEVNSNSFGLYEVQLYSKVIVPISTVTARNSTTSYINQNVMQR